ncbi:hypothetical protein V6N13_040011 [Hibiscus sabdariffa]
MPTQSASGIMQSEMSSKPSRMNEETQASADKGGAEALKCSRHTLISAINIGSCNNRFRIASLLINQSSA